MEKCNAPELGVLYYYKHFLKILCKLVKKLWFYRHFSAFPYSLSFSIQSCRSCYARL
jgi:hypothetical protein